jgi:uncharacterized protein YcaQ
MRHSVPTIPARSARRLLLGAQGLLSSPRQNGGAQRVQELVEQLGFVQIDSINVVERAHHLTLATRLDSYQREHLAHLLETERSLFEHWTHDASAIPTKWFEHWKPRFSLNKERIRQNRWWQQRVGNEPDRVIEHVRERIAKAGPLRSKDFERDSTTPSSGWWGWKPQKAALEYLWSTGELTIVRRESFQKVYDLTERVLPCLHAGPTPSEEEHVDWACNTAMERLVIATPKEIADFWNTITLDQAKKWCEEKVADQSVIPVVVASLSEERVRESFALPDWEIRLKNLPEPPQRLRLLCPFDPVLRDRRRLERLFGFSYRFEAFVPAAKRQHGYFVLPILEGDRLVGRLDPKMHRDRGFLEVRKIWWEPSINLTKTRARKLEEAIARLARLVGANNFSLPKQRISSR